MISLPELDRRAMMARTLRFANLLAVGFGTVGFTLVFPYLFSHWLQLRLQGAPPWIALVGLLPLPVLLIGLVRVYLRWRTSRRESRILDAVLDEPLPPLARLRQRWTLLTRGRSTWLCSVAWQRLLDQQHEAAARAWVALLELEPHDASARAGLAFYDCHQGHASAGTVELLESSLEHAGRFMPNQLVDASALAWATLAWAHHQRGQLRDRDAARARAEQELKNAPEPVRIVAERALEALA